MQIIESLNALEVDGTEDKEIQVPRGGFLSRLFDPDPTLPLWQKTKTKIIQVPHYKPAMFRVMDKLIVHPSLMPKIGAAIAENTAANVYRW